MASRKRPHRGAAVACAVAVAALVSATPAGARPAASAGTGVTLRMWIMPNSPQPVADLEAVLRPFETRTGIDVSVEQIGWDVQFQKIQNAAVSGVGPDLTQAGTTQVPYFAALGGFTDLSSRTREIGGAAAYPAAAWKTTRIVGKPGVWAVPWFTDVRAIFYRTDVYRKAGIDPAKAFASWDNFKAALKKIRKVRLNGKPIAPIGIEGNKTWNVAHNLFPWIWEAGGGALTPDLKSGAVDTPQALNGVMYFTGLVPAGLAYKPALEKNAPQVEALFHNGTIATMITGPWMVASSLDPAAGWAKTTAARNYAVAPMPAGPQGRATFLGGSNLIVFKSSKHQSEAWQLVRYLSSLETQLAYARVSGMLPARTAAQSRQAKVNAKYAAFAEALEHGRSYPSIPAWGAIEGVYVKHFSTIWDMAAGVSGTYDRASVMAVLRRAAREVTQLIREQG